MGNQAHRHSRAGAKVTQHSAIEIEVPFIDMVNVTSGGNVMFLDKPAAIRSQ